jgi:ABC-type polysaccharide/polyol phosphate export permease
VNLLRAFAFACIVVAVFWLVLGALHLLFNRTGGVVGMTVLVLVMLTGIVWVVIREDGS